MSYPLEDRVTELEQEVVRLRQKVSRQETDNTVCIVCFSGEWDKIFAALTIANGALALGCDVHIFCTFWGASLLRGVEDPKCRSQHQDWMQRVLNWLLPRTLRDLPLSKFNCCGLGKRALRSLMKRNGVADLETLMQDARELGAYFHICDTSVSLFGWTPGEIPEEADCDRCGVTSFLALSLKSRSVFFI